MNLVLLILILCLPVQLEKAFPSHLNQAFFFFHMLLLSEISLYHSPTIQNGLLYSLCF